MPEPGPLAQLRAERNRLIRLQDGLIAALETAELARAKIARCRARIAELERQAVDAGRQRQEAGR